MFIAVLISVIIVAFTKSIETGIVALAIGLIAVGISCINDIETKVIIIDEEETEVIKGLTNNT